MAKRSLDSEELLWGAEATQRLQGCHRLRGRGLVAGSSCDAGLSLLRNSKLGDQAGGPADRDRVSDRTDNCLGL